MCVCEREREREGAEWSACGSLIQCKKRNTSKRERADRTAGGNLL